MSFSKFTKVLTSRHNIARHDYCCMQVRQHTNLPFILDENMDSLEAILKAHKLNACDVINLKISKFGGLTKAKQVIWSQKFYFSINVLDKVYM